MLDNNYRLSVLTDDGDWHGVVSLGREDFGDFADAPKSGVTIFFGQYHAAAISPNGRGGFSGRTVARNYMSWAGNDFHVSELFGKAFYFGTSWLLDFGNPRWLRVTPAGFTEIEGSSRVVLSGSAILDGNRQQSVHDLSSIHRTLFQGRDGFYLYDGHAIVPVPNSGPDVVGRYPKFLDMPTLRRSLVEGQTGIFEVTPAGRLEKVALPLDVWGLQEWPQAHVGLVWADGAVYGPYADLTLTKHALPVSPGPVHIHSVSAPNTDTGDVLISSSAGLFLAVTRAGGNDGACHDRK